MTRSGHGSTETDRQGAADCELEVSGMDCASCAATIEHALGAVRGVHDVRVDVVGGRVRVRYDASTVAPHDFTRAIRRVGYGASDPSASSTAAHPSPDERERSRAGLRQRRARMIVAGASGLALAMALLARLADAPAPLVVALLAVSTVAGGWFVVPRGVRAAAARSLDMNFLMSVAAAGAWIIGEPTEAAATLFLFALAELLEAYSMDRARKAIAALMDLSPTTATVLRAGEEARVPATDVAIGETVLVRPGEKIAVDGEVVHGRSSLNEAPITGESMPVDKKPGDIVFAGSLNGHGALHVRSTRAAGDTTLARIIHAVEEAQASRAPTQRFVDRFARVYTPAVVLIALLIAVLPPLAGIGSWEAWIYRALAMLVVACPCALVISTPVSIVSGLAGSARAGILVKGGVHLENAGSLSVVCFDKTGTLTTAHPVVTDVLAFAERTVADVVSLAMGVERHSEHPLAVAVLEYGRALGLAAPHSAGFAALPGRGARAMVGGIPTSVGNGRLARELGIADPAATEALERLEQEGKTAVLVIVDRQAAGVIAIADDVRREAASAVRALRHAGVRRTILLTGDNERTARAVAGRLGIDEYRSGLLPDDKVRIVRDLEAAGERVGFVGDGVNDAPALAAATVGFAMGSAGTDVALETADIALMTDDLTKVALAVHHSRRTLRIIRQNVTLAIAIKAVFLVLAAGGWATLWMAVAADMGASLVVVLNGMRAIVQDGSPRTPAASESSGGVAR
jgi:Cd2+/Zn2+-exporting ATPase